MLHMSQVVNIATLENKNFVDFIAYAFWMLCHQRVVSPEASGCVRLQPPVIALDDGIKTATTQRTIGMLERTPFHRHFPW
jgi:hypothetical protein